MSIRTRRNVGVIGLGIIGQRVSDNLRVHGFHVFVWNRTPRPVPNFVGSPAEVVELCDFVQLFVSDDEALLEMVQRMMRNLTSHHIIMAHSTVSPDTMRAAAEMVERRGARFLDAPFTGSKTAAENGQLVYYVGGDEVALRQARPVLEASSKEIIEIGKVGDATTIKVATNMVTAASVQGAAEALALVHKSGLPVEKFIAAMRNNGSNSVTLDMKLPMMIEGNFEPHFSVKHMLKDVVIATRLARAFAIEFGATDASRHGLVEEMRQGRGDADYSSLFRQYVPSGRPLQRDQPSNGEEDQPRLSGIDEEKAAEQKKAEDIAVPATAESGAKESGEQPSDMPTEPGADASDGTAHEKSAGGGTNGGAQEARAEALAETAPKANLSESTGSHPIAVTHERGSVSIRGGSESEIAPTESPGSPQEVGKPRGMWGGFWPRRMDD